MRRLSSRYLKCRPYLLCPSTNPELEELERETLFRLWIQWMDVVGQSASHQLSTCHRARLLFHTLLIEILRGWVTNPFTYHSSELLGLEPRSCTQALQFIQPQAKRVSTHTPVFNGYTENKGTKCLRARP